MQFTLTKNKWLPSILAGLTLALSIALFLLSNLNIQGAFLLPSLSALCLVLTLFTVGRFLTFDMTYRIGGDYSDFSFSVHHIRQGQSKEVARYELLGTEELVLLDRCGKKKRKKQKKLAVHTANLVPKYPYALFYTLDGKTGYLYLELNDAARDALQSLIARAKEVYSASAD